MRDINLLPPYIAQQRRARQITFLLVAGGLGLVALLIMVFLIQTARLAGERSRLEEVQRDNRRVEAQVRQLQGFAQLQSTLRTKEQLLGRLTANEVRWSLLLNNISLRIPSDVWLTNLSGSVQPPVTTGPAQPGRVATVGTIQVAGVTFTHLDVARWLSRLSDVDEFLFPYLSLSSKSAIANRPVVDFNSSVQLSQEALRSQQEGGQRTP